MITASHAAPPVSRRRWLARRTSVIHLLVLLTLIPSAGLPAFAWSFVRDRHDRAQSADRVAQGLRQVGQLDQLRGALAAEITASVAQGALHLLDLPPSAMALIPPSMLPDARSTMAATDSALAPLVRNDLSWVRDGNASLARIKIDLAAGREQARRAVGHSSAVDHQSGLITQSRYLDVASQIQALEKMAVDTIASGGLGISTPELLAATAQAQAVSAVVIQGNLTSQFFFAARLAQTADDQVISGLAQASATYDTLATDLAPRLSPAVRREWATVLASPQIRSLRVQEAQFIADAQHGHFHGLSLDVAGLIDQAQTGAAGVALTQALDAVLVKAVAEGIAVARDAQSAAAARARTGAGLAGLALVSTLSMVVILGGAIRRRLTALAAAAQRLSSGTLEPMPVSWPREVAIASQGLNDAVLNLNEITSKAALIARGDIASPMLERPSPGPLGAAMHASFESVVTMVREREALQHELAHQASHDALTGLANRGQAEHLLTAAVAEARRGQGRVGLLFIDLDHFKAINDTYGHAAGDHVLSTVSQRLAHILGGAATACRLGGDEFLALVPRLTGTAELTDLAANLTVAINEPIFYQEHVLSVGASIGISVWPTGGETGPLTAGTSADIAEQMLSEADSSMYRDKAAHRASATP